MLGEQISFFHLDCLCSDVRLNVDFDLTLTVLADLLYRNLVNDQGIQPDWPVKAVSEVRRHSGCHRDHRESGDRSSEQASARPSVKRGRPDRADAARALAERTVGAFGVPLKSEYQELLTHSCRNITARIHACYLGVN